jgi:hypothetical protein
VRHSLVFVLALATSATTVACGPQMQTVSLVNHTNRKIVELYIYPNGSTEHGASRGTLAPNASMKLTVKAGKIEVLAVSEMIKHDDNTRETPTVSHGLELTQPLEVVFYDMGEKPAGLDRPGVIGAAFRRDKTESTPEPAPESPEPPAP